MEQTREHSRNLPNQIFTQRLPLRPHLLSVCSTKDARLCCRPVVTCTHFTTSILLIHFLRSSFQESYHFCSCLTRMSSVTHCEFVKGLINWLIDWLTDLEGTVQRAWVVSSSFSVLNISTHFTKMKWEEVGYLWDVVEEMWPDYILLLTFISLLYLMCNYVI